jgi:hypothetical protein
MASDQERELRKKGEWAETAAEGVVPDDLGSDATEQADEPELTSSVVGTTTGSDEPATDEGVDLEGGELADATSDGAPEGAVLPDSEPDREPDLKDAAVGPRQSDLDSAK